MNKTLFSILYVFCIVSHYFVGQIQVPGLPFNFNVLSILLLFVACLLVEKPMVDKWMISYCLFLLFFAISAIITGGFPYFIHLLYSTFFMSFVAYWATGILICHYDTVRPLIFPIVIIGVVNALVTVSQAYGISIANPLLTMIIENTDQDEILAANDYELGYAISGLYLNPVFNGHYLLFFFLISLLPQVEKLNIFALAFSLIIYVGILFCQQRSAFMFSTIALLFILYYRIKAAKKLRYLLVLLFILASAIACDYLADYLLNSGSRLSDTSSTGREETWVESLNFISNHPLLGGYDLCRKVYGLYSHNLILSAFIAGGLFGGIAIIWLVGNQFVYFIRKQRHSKNMLFFTVGIVYFCMIMDSMFHNTGLVEMDFSTFISWGLFSTILCKGMHPSVSFFEHKHIK